MREEVNRVAYVFKKLLRSNFRCGRMLYSRTAKMAGRFSAPLVQMSVSSGNLC